MTTRLPESHQQILDRLAEALDRWRFAVLSETYLRILAEREVMLMRNRKEERSEP